MPYLPKTTELGKLEIIEVYEFYDIPRLFACLNQFGNYYLALSVSEVNDQHIWIYAPISKTRLKNVRSGEIDLYDAFKHTEEGCALVVNTSNTNHDTAKIKICDDIPNNWLPIKGAKLEIPKSKEIPKGQSKTNEVLLPGMEEAAESYDNIIVRAFSETRIVAKSGTKEYLSSDRVIADPYLDSKFIEQCKEYGLEENANYINLRLMALRKANKLSHLHPSKGASGLNPDVNNTISFASELALRIMVIQKGVTLDQILCDPILAKEFDKLAKSMSPGFSSLEYRLAALGIRKRGRFKQVDETFTFESTENVKKLKIEKIPIVAGLYMFSSNDFPVFINQTNNLRHRIELHLNNSEQKGLPEWIWEKPLQHSYIELPNSTLKFRGGLELVEMREREPFLNVFKKIG